MSLSLQNSPRVPKLNARNCIAYRSTFLGPNVREKIHQFLSGTKKRCTQKKIGSFLSASPCTIFCRSSSNLDDLDALLGGGLDKKPDHDRDREDSDNDSDSSSDSSRGSNSSSSSSSSDSDSSSSDGESAVSEILSQVDTSEAGAQSHPQAAAAAAAALPVPTDTLVDLNIPSSAAASREVRFRCLIYNNR